jgi:hypothetical protein
MRKTAPWAIICLLASCSSGLDDESSASPKPDHSFPMSEGRACFEALTTDDLHRECGGEWTPSVPSKELIASVSTSNLMVFRLGFARDQKTLIRTEKTLMYFQVSRVGSSTPTSQLDRAEVDVPAGQSVLRAVLHTADYDFALTSVDGSAGDVSAPLCSGPKLAKLLEKAAAHVKAALQPATQRPPN